MKRFLMRTGLLKVRRFTRKFCREEKNMNHSRAYAYVTVIYVQLFCFTSYRHVYQIKTRPEAHTFSDRVQMAIKKQSIYRTRFRRLPSGLGRFVIQGTVSLFLNDDYCHIKGLAHPYIRLQ